jgi:hypothetical protein
MIWASVSPTARSFIEAIAMISAAIDSFLLGAHFIGADVRRLSGCADVVIIEL